MQNNSYKPFRYILISILILGLCFGVFKIFTSSAPKAEFVTSTSGNSLFQIKNAKAFEASFGQEENMPDMVFKTGDSEIRITIPYENAKWERTEKGIRAISNGIIYDYSMIKNNKEQPAGIKEEITLNELTKYGSFIFPSLFKNLTPQNINGIWKFYDNNWQEKFYIPKPFMIDANNNRSEDVEIEVSVDGKFIKITPDAGWLNSPQRKYPIIIDPSLVVPDNPEEVMPLDAGINNPSQPSPTFTFRTSDNNIIEIGTEKHSPPKPYIKLNKWNSEVSLKVNIPVEVDENPEIQGNKLKYKSLDQANKIDVDIYPKQPETITETDSKGNQHSFTINDDGGVEFDTILYEKPSSNRISFNLETQGLKFYYQPPLNQEQHRRPGEICSETTCWNEQGQTTAFRPENVVGSYAVYHESKRDHILGQTNYMTGKAFHIYRPKISDANGQETWGSLEINEQTSTLSVIVPQEFLDSAVYPINIDPTFGYTGAGKTEDSSGEVGYCIESARSPHLASNGDAIIGYSIYAYSGSGGTVDFAAYNQASPFERLAAAVTSPTIGIVGWYSVSSLNQPMGAGKTYASAWGNITSNAIYFYYDDLGSPWDPYMNVQQLPANWSTLANTYAYSGYATYSSSVPANINGGMIKINGGIINAK